MSKDKREAHLNYLSVLSVLSAVCVVILHCNVVYWEFSSTERYWASANAIESICYFAVPVFFMCSGATLIDYQDRYSTRQFFIRRIQKTLIPFLAWSIIGMFWCMSTYGGAWVKWKDINFWYVLRGIVECDFVSIYWFFPALFGVYFSIPLFASVEKEKRKTIFTYLAVAAFVLNILFPFLQTVSHRVLMPGETQVRVAYTYLFYVIVGYLISHYEIDRKWRLFLYAAGAAGLLLHMIGTYRLSMEAGSIVKTYKGYTNLPCAAYSIAIFVLFKQIGPVLLKTKPVRYLVMHLSDYNFSIYLMHWFIIVVMRTELQIDSRAILWRVGGCIPVILISVGIAFLLKRIPGIKLIVP